ncbi:MAG: rhodanese-like domain-containing protein [Rhizobiales bacterium]|nr:rhodanese-like domain-containing protein [Hyphomicrobiales bacterium]NRB14211.1 rhodanese-like domain-containing protein [Hyphomicrobiales bacterium]
MARAYAGIIEANAAYNLLKSDSSCCIIDVRTSAEITFVGAPNLADAKNRYCLIEWQLFPTMQKNDKFVEQLNAQLAEWEQQDGIQSQDRPLLFLCRSGVRSEFAAEVATQMGCTKCYNIVGGFEGDPDINGHRAKVSGWQFLNLPWSQ